MYVEQEFYFWKLVHELVVVHDFQVLHIQSTESEVWLEKTHKRRNHVVRLKHGQLNWRNEMKRDLLVMAERMKQNRQLFPTGRTNLHMIYVSEYPPVDEWESVVHEWPEQKMDLDLYYFSDENKSKEKQRLLRVFDIESMDTYEQGASAEEMEEMTPHLKHQIVSYQKRRQQQDQKVFEFGKPKVTYWLLILNILMFFYIETVGSSTSITTLIEYGAKYNPGIIDGEWWRIVSSMFLHIGMLHLFMNMLALFYLGTAVERIYGSIRFTGIYFLAGIFGGLASFMLNPHVAAGASGAIFGLFGALLYFGVHHSQLFFRTMGWNLIFVIGINVAFGLMVPQIDNGAHMGGLIGGFIASALFSLPDKRNGKQQTAALFIYLVSIAGMGVLGYQSVFNGQQALSQVQETQELNQQEEFEQVIKLTTEALEQPGDYEAELRFNRSYALIQQGEIDQATEDLKRVLELTPDLAEAHYNLALLYQQQGDQANARKHAMEAADLSPDEPNFQELVEEVSEP
ncbi:rhomboid family intramembrane serine protease [Halobacillus fulvus]|nr:rhomboid family intramembrane serine protease [Halobacillus fulvus]